MSRLATPAPRRIARITCEILRPVPVAALEVAASIVRSGNRLDFVEAKLVDEAGAVVMVASAWRLPDERIDLPQKAGGEVPDTSVETAMMREFFPVSHDVDYHTVSEWRFGPGAWLEPGPAMAWTRTRVPLIEGENPSWVERLLLAADSASGISAVLDPLVWSFKNVHLTVEVDRLSMKSGLVSTLLPTSAARSSVLREPLCSIVVAWLGDPLKRCSLPLGNLDSEAVL